MRKLYLQREFSSYNNDCIMQGTGDVQCFMEPRALLQNHIWLTRNPAAKQFSVDVDANVRNATNVRPDNADAYNGHAN